MQIGYGARGLANISCIDLNPKSLRYMNKLQLENIRQIIFHENTQQIVHDAG
jgi:S-adenosylmethionine:diacylglycerol 3-amino-3-carboxypropyl transferase